MSTLTIIYYRIKRVSQISLLKLLFILLTTKSCAIEINQINLAYNKWFAY